MSEYLLLNLNDVIEKYPFTKGQLRGYILNRKENGLDKAVRKIGKRLYFREDLLIEWIESHQ